MRIRGQRTGALASGLALRRSPACRGFLALLGLQALLALTAAAPPLAAQVSIGEEPDPAARVAAQRKLRRYEAASARALLRSHGDPALGERFGEAMRARPIARLDHPSRALRAAIAAARDPAALALAIADDASWGGEDASYEVDVVLTALALPVSRPRRTALWAKAAALEGQDEGMRLAFIERAYESLAEPSRRAAGPSGSGTEAAGSLAAAAEPAACALATWRLSALLGKGLAHEAVATFRALPPALRERIETGRCEQLPDGIDGVRIDGNYDADERLSLVAALLLEGDADGGRGLLARVPGAAWHAGDPKGSDGVQHASAVWRAVLDRWLAGTAADDAFPLLAEFAEANLFGMMRTSYGVGLMLYARLADREECPSIARYAWWQASRPADRVPTAPTPLPPAVVASARRLAGALDERARRALAAHEAAEAAVAREHWPATPIILDGKPFDMRSVTLLALDRERRRGIVFIDNAPYYGEVYRLEASGDSMVATRATYWIS